MLRPSLPLGGDGHVWTGEWLCVLVFRCHSSLDHRILAMTLTSVGPWQLRLSLGQVIDRRERYRATNRSKSVQAVLFVEVESRDPRMGASMEADEVILAWPRHRARVL